jgi:hypothetical protein
MKLFGMAGSLKDRIERLDHQNLSDTEFVGLLVDHEYLSFVAQARGQHVCRRGFAVQYLRLPMLLTQLVRARAPYTYDRLFKRVAKLSPIVLDDFGLAAFSELE